MFSPKVLFFGQTSKFLKNRGLMLKRCPMALQYTRNPMCYTKVHYHSSEHTVLSLPFMNLYRPTSQHVSSTFLQNYPFVKIHTSCSNKREINVKEFEKLQNKGVTVIDVRNSSEINASGTIPGSLNIPIDTLNNELKKSGDDFKAKYGRNKPSKNESILFLCQRGSRSKKAMDAATKLGYNKAMSLKGGWETFSKN